jgi:RHS repeat-associated protein
LNRVASFNYDGAGRVTSQTLPGNRTIAYNYDANGNLTSLTPPGKTAHTFSYTPVNLVASYSAPAVAGGGTNQTTYSYNIDKQPTSITRPDGQLLNFGYDSAGRLNALTIPTGVLSYSYSPTTGNLTGITSPGGVTLTYSYDGSLPTGEALSGTIVGNVTRTFDNNFRVTSQSVNGGNTVNFSYDQDSLLTGVGSMTISRNAQNGLITGTTLGNIATGMSYNGFAELATHTAANSGTNFYSATYTRDKLGRITQKVETISGTTITYDYRYDSAGRLDEVRQNGTVINTYTYDSNGNRLSKNSTTAIYDAQDRLTSYGTNTYSYTANGELTSKVNGAQTTSYQYDVLGNLVGATLPSGTNLNYIVDGQQRRIGKRVNGTLTQGFLYDGKLRIVAELDGSNAIVSRFVYGTKVNVPEYMLRGGVTYRLVTDHLGSVRLVVNTANGTIAQRIDYDEFGIVTSDTNPGFQPFGFAGGLYDNDLKLVRFGARDYDSESGRWTAKDPIGFEGGDTNLHAYVGNEPLDTNDSNGLIPVWDVVDVGFATWSWSDFLNCPGWESFGWATLDTIALLPIIPSSGWLRRGSEALDVIKKGPIPNQMPRNLTEQLALEEAKANGGKEIIKNLGDTPRLIDNYGPGEWVKMRHTHESLGGSQTDIHWFHNKTTGQNVEYKFK